MHDLHMVQSSPRYLLANNFAGVPETTITRLKQVAALNDVKKLQL